MLATECTQSSFEFAGAWSRSVVARFDRGKITSDAGGLLLREVDRQIGLSNRLRLCFGDGRAENHPAAIRIGVSSPKPISSCAVEFKRQHSSLTTLRSY